MHLFLRVFLYYRWKHLSDIILKVNLSRPIEGFLELLTMPVFWPQPAARQEQPLGVQEFADSNGPFRLKAEEDQLIILEKNPYYWGKRQVQLDEVRIIVEPNPYAVIYKFNSGQLHWSGGIDLSGLSKSYLTSKSRRTFKALRRLFYLDFDEVQDMYKEEAVRRALSLAIDRPLLSTYVVTSTSRKNSSFVLRGLKRYKPRYFLGFSVRKALKELRQAGYCVKDAAKEACTPLTPIKLFHDGSDLHKKIALGLAAAWTEKLGIKVAVHPDTEADQVQKGDSSFFIEETWAQTPGGDNFLRAWSPYANNRFKLVLNQALENRSRRSKTKIFRQAEKNLITTLPVIPLVVGQDVATVRRDVKGFYDNILDLHPLKYIYF